MCDCGSLIIYTDYATKICTECGIETRGPLENHDTYFESGGPLFMSYSRNRRFAQMLRAVIYPHKFYPKSHILYALEQTKPYVTVDSLLLALRKLKINNKQYQYLHIYCSLLQENYVKPPYVRIETFNDIMRAFANIEMMFDRTEQKTFFSYNWLLRKLLRNAKLYDYVKYVKEIKCKKRNTLYENMINNLT